VGRREQVSGFPRGRIAPRIHLRRAGPPNQERRGQGRLAVDYPTAVVLVLEPPDKGQMRDVIDVRGGGPLHRHRRARRDRNRKDRAQCTATRLNQWTVAEQSPQIITLSLTSPEEMFTLAPVDLFSEYRNFMTGLEYCISVLRSRRSAGPVQIKLGLPPDQIAEETDQRIARTLYRYCEHRISYNQRERRASRRDGVFSLWVGFPIVVVGFILVIIKGSIVGSTGNANLVLDTGGWVLVWVGLWFPLDTLLFTPLAYGRENRVLKRLRTADVIVEPRPMMKNL
jgi:hypothetical protein